MFITLQAPSKHKRLAGCAFPVRVCLLAGQLALYYGFDWAELRTGQRNAVAWSLRMAGCDPVMFIHEGAPAISMRGRIHFYTAACTYLDLFATVSPFLWVFGAGPCRNLLRFGIAALVIFAGNVVRCGAALYLDALGIDMFYAHDLPDYFIWWPTVAIFVLIALRRDCCRTLCESHSPGKDHDSAEPR
jgi:hypothetical protein